VTGCVPWKINCVELRNVKCTKQICHMYDLLLAVRFYNVSPASVNIMFAAFRSFILLRLQVYK